MGMEEQRDVVAQLANLGQIRINVASVPEQPIQATISGAESPIRLGPLQIKIGTLQVQPQVQLTFYLFGRIPLFSIRVGGETKIAQRR